MRKKRGVSAQEPGGEEVPGTGGRPSRGTLAVVFVAFSILMILTGISDALRGVFLPTFRKHFELSGQQSSWIIMISYVGNLIFLLAGGRFVDRVRRRTALITILGIWCAAFAIYFLTDSYVWLLFGMIFSMGASTLLSTTLNVFSAAVFVSSPGLFINLFGFIQGIGTSGSQNLFGNLAEEFRAWQITNGIMLAVAAAMLLLICVGVRIPEERPRMDAARALQGNLSYRQILRVPAFRWLVLVFGFYFVAEHGIMNWMTTYAQDGLGLTFQDGTLLLSVFFLGITIGRLILSPLVDRLGMFRCFGLFAAVATALYVTGMLLGRPGIWLVAASGFFCALLYPTMVLMVGAFFPRESIATATGTVISVGTLFDIAFNLFFGGLSDQIGIRLAILVLPVCMAAFMASFVMLYRLKRRRSRTASCDNQ